MEHDKEEKILRAAEKVFFRKGFFSARMEDIAEEASVAKGTLYLYFKDKTSIYIHLINHRLDDAINMIGMINRQKISATEKLERFFDEMARYFAQAKETTSFVSIENINLTDELMKKMKGHIKPKMLKSVDLIAQIIESGIKSNEFKKINPQIAAMYFLHLIPTFLISRVHFVDIKDRNKTIKELFFDGIKDKKESK
jgi:TetR/AcrR family fatty acid metabolism transcriptional regulator